MSAHVLGELRLEGGRKEPPITSMVIANSTATETYSVLPTTYCVLGTAY